MLPERLGVARVTKFELVHLIGILVLRSKEQGFSPLSYADAETQILNGSSPMFVRRKYTDGESQTFSVLRDGRLEKIDS